MLACGWLKTQSSLLSLLFLIFKKDLKCLVQLQFCSSERVNKGHCWQSSISPGKGWEGEGHSSLPGGLGWAGSCPVQKKSSLYWPPTIPEPEDRGDFKALLLSRTSGTLCIGPPPGSAHLTLATPSSGPRSSWSFSHGLSLPSPLPSTIHLQQSLPGQPLYLSGIMFCVHGHVRILN